MPKNKVFGQAGGEKTAIGIAASYVAGVSIEAKDAIIYNRYEK